MTKLSNTFNDRTATATAPHVIVAALAGTGKTTTLVEALNKLMGKPTRIQPSPQQQAVWETIGLSKGARSVCFVAFNKSIATELQRRVPQGCDAMTMHSMGLKAVTKAFGRVKVESYRVSNIISELLETDIRELRRKDFELLRATEQLVGLCKMNLTGLVNPLDKIPTANAVDWDEELDRLASHYDIDLNGSRERVFQLVPQVLERCKHVDRDKCIDFNDMIWLPVVLGLNVWKYDLLLVDECQDLNRCQQALARKAGQRLVLCGDMHQAIYGFAGADAESMQRMQTELEATDEGCTVLPLTVTRRCGKAIVAEACQIVEGFEAHESNGEGLISRAVYDGQAKHKQPLEPAEADKPSSYVDMVQDGDMLLCRVNAPLVSQCFRFLKLGRRAEIQGRDIGQGLISTVKKMKAGNVPELVEKLSDWLHRETEKENRKRVPNENRLIGLQDRYDCLICFTDNVDTVDAVLKKIEAVFTDSENGVGIKLSSIHRAKGLEANRVFLLEPKGATVPHSMARSAWQKAQEMNLRYVAITRAIHELIYVS